ncbi:MAG TPA: hypothetical protein DDW76_17480 [Cyanobacteria bacterium UBA11369]|nr:hypothetical protein [Cyanobacteria bacterium UBA11371]HBE32377.1 hypothetical protein [Cyanobacteria bacterium UBA11368]HBE50536.1 hypothetical protein [Cyanobacteria bacterium UBA11369]
MTLTGDQRKQLKHALNDAFPTKPKLSQFVKEELEKNLDEIALGDDLGEIIFKLIQHTESHGWEDQLIFAARHYNPGNPKLAAFVRVYQREYWEKLAQQKNFYILEELDASNAIVEAQTEVVQVIESNPNVNNELMYLLREILAKLNEPGTPAAGKVKLALPLIPGILSYEVELDTENSLRRAFQPIKQLFEGK